MAHERNSWNEIGYLLDLLRYDAWANREVLPVAVADERVLHLLGHLARAKDIWLMRVEGKETVALELWPRTSLEDLRESLPRTDRQWIERIAVEIPDRAVEYRNQSGNRYSTPLREIVIHVANHGTYHRGQLATAITQAGGSAAATDYIVWSRAGRPG